MKTINNNITESFVNFDNAKLLKEKGFGVIVNACYNEDGSIEDLDTLWHRGCEGGMGLEEWYFNYNNFAHAILYSQPTQQVAIDFIRINFQLHITITSISQESWQYHITKIGDCLGKTFGEDFYTPEEAKEAAINHVLITII
jgi:recombinational DNA repair protein (RecF pathway)